MITAILWTVCVPINLTRIYRAVKEIKSYGREVDVGGVVFMVTMSTLAAPMMTSFVIVEYLVSIKE